MSSAVGGGGEATSAAAKKARKRKSRTHKTDSRLPAATAAALLATSANIAASGGITLPRVAESEPKDNKTARPPGLLASLSISPCFFFIFPATQQPPSPTPQARRSSSTRGGRKGRKADSKRVGSDATRSWAEEGLVPAEEVEIGDLVMVLYDGNNAAGRRWQERRQERLELEGGPGDVASPTRAAAAEGQQLGADDAAAVEAATAAAAAAAAPWPHTASSAAAESTAGAASVGDLEGDDGEEGGEGGFEEVGEAVFSLVFGPGGADAETQGLAPMTLVATNQPHRPSPDAQSFAIPASAAAAAMMQE